MKEKTKIWLKLVLLIAISVYTFFSLLIVNFGFGYLNQSSLSPTEEQLTFLNYLLPLILAIGFMFYFPLRITQRSKHSPSGFKKWVRLIVLVVLAAMSLPWQVEQLVWQMGRDTTYLTELTPYLITIIFTIGTLRVESSNLSRTIDRFT